MRLLKFGICFFVLLSAGGCSWIGLDSAPEPLAQTAGDLQPFKVEVADEVNDGQRLHVLGAVTAATDWKLNDIVIKLSSLDSGKIKDVSFLPMSRAKKPEEVPNGIIKAGERVQFSISIPAENITDYQLELVWGRDAQEYLGKSTKGPAELEIRNIELETHQVPCDLGACDQKFTILGKLFNVSNSLIESVTLGAGFVKSGIQGASSGDLDLSTGIPDNEERIEIGNLHLLPGESRAFKLELDRAVPQASGLRPVLRILSYHKV